MTAIATPAAPTLEATESGGAILNYVKDVDADTYTFKAYSGGSYTVHETGYDKVVTASGSGAASVNMALPPNASLKVTVTLHDSTAVKTDSAESPKSSALTSTIEQEADMTEASVVAETINPFTGKAFVFAGTQAHSQNAYTRNGDGTVSQVLSDAVGAMGTQGARDGTQKTKRRDAGDVTAIKSIASDLVFKLTTPSDPTNGVAVVDPVALTVSTPSNTSEQTAVVGEGAATSFSDRVGKEADAADVIYGAGASF